ncbi:hypothetical protein AAVH_24282 [Aphelenchoides avenae]|nr:hypothetical protein AAVH_24282 [Aphelenchus avenae]
MNIFDDIDFNELVDENLQPSGKWGADDDDWGDDGGFAPSKPKPAAAARDNAAKKAEIAALN